MRRVGRLRQVAARDFVLALRAGFNMLQPAPDREVDGLIITDFEMQERMMLDRAPVAAEQRLGADEVDRACDPFRRASPSPARPSPWSRRSRRKTNG
jgi:hypothetical protein